MGNSNARIDMYTNYIFAMNFDIVIDESSAHYFLHELDLMRLSEYEFLFPKTDGGDTYTIPI